MANQNTNPVTQEELDEIRRLHSEGYGRNEISRRIGRSLRTISVHAAKMGLTFDRTMTEEATRARKADLEERRVILAEALQGDAEQLTERLWQRYRVFNFGGKDNTYESEVLDEPPADAQKALMSAAGIAIDKSLKLAPPDTDMEGLAAVDAWLRGMMPDQQ
ncbi:helix-turn-helix domain-containing protein [Streptomyces sp. NPDC052773]|uniref:helix-turn-helix domain-containing protein n=1 Tax=Streptomyces sp. NPDC052773 TaxID=3365693 RepID=UPI0037CDA8F9